LVGAARMSDAWTELERLVQDLPVDLRRRAAEEWAQAAQAEHASIASFARFTLQLLAIAAPPSLIASSHRAGMDELEHARSSFRLASIYAGRPLGPGALPLGDSALGPTDFASIVRSTVEEGCVGETLSAIEAEAASKAARPQAVREVLARIADEEAAHARLAYETVAWALATEPAAAVDAVRSGFATAIAAARAEPPLESARDGALRDHGRLPAAERRALRLKAIAEVIEPAAAELLGT
jgi:hypothetical protein